MAHALARSTAWFVLLGVAALGAIAARAEAGCTMAAPGTLFSFFSRFRR